MDNKFLSEKASILCRLTNAGLSEEQASIVADCFATADVWGVSSHGARILPAHIDKIKRGGYNLMPQFKIVSESCAFAVVDGDNSFGPVSGKFCMDLAVTKAKKTGVFHVFCKNNNTIGPAFYYPLLAAKESMIGIVFSNSPAQMAPFGGKEKMLGTNPFAAVIPVPGRDPIVIDMATSIVAKSKFKEYKEAGKQLPEGWALDENGNPTTDPDDGMKGFVQPMAGFKGYGLAMLIDIISGVLSGSAYLNKVGRFYSEDNKPMNVGFTCIAINPEIIIGSDYSKRINDYVDSLRNSEKSGESPIALPGDDRIKFLHNKNK